MKPRLKFLMVSLCFAVLFGAMTSRAATVTVTITNLSFSPNPVIIEAGDTVRWTNSDFVLYSAASDTAAWASPTLLWGQTYSYTFNTVGTYPYHCGYHPTMTASVIVRAKVTAMPGQVTLLSAVNQEVFNYHRPQFMWSTTFPAATWYNLWINKEGEFYHQEWIQDSSANDLPTTGGSPATGQSTLSTNRWMPTNDLPNGNYTWAVQTWNAGGYGSWSDIGSFWVFGGAPGLASLMSPTNGATATSRRPILQWTNAPAAATWYNLWINKDNQYYHQEWIQSTPSWAPTNDLPNGVYTWWVQTWNPDGYGAWSSVSAFNVISLVPGITTLISPTNYQGAIGRRPTLLWTNAPPAAAWYYLWINKDDQVYHQEWTQNPRWTSTNDLPSGRYDWAVRTWNTEGDGPWSTNSLFFVPITLPGIIGMDLAVVKDTTTVQYQWNADMGATWYELWITENGKVLFDKWYYTGVTTGLIGLEIDGHNSGAGYQWWVRGWNPDGFGPWSGPLVFTMP